MRVGPQDKPFITPELKKLSRSKSREYCKNGRSAKYQDLKSLFNKKIQVGCPEIFGEEEGRTENH